MQLRFCGVIVFAANPNWESGTDEPDSVRSLGSTLNRAGLRATPPHQLSRLRARRLHSDQATAASADKFRHPRKPLVSPNTAG